MPEDLDRLTAPLALHALQWGLGGCPRVLLVHGLQSAASTWWQVADALAGRGLHVTAPDLRGHGGSPSARRYGIADFASDLRGVGEGWDLVVGHSLGGTVVAAALAEPDGATFARRAVLLEPVFDLPEGDFDALVAGQLSELAAADAAVLQRENPGWHPEDCRHKALAAAMCSPYVAEAVLRENRPWDYGGLLERVEAPVLIMGGDPARGAMLEPALGRALAAAGSNLRYQHWTGAGHAPHRDLPDLVIRALLGALQAPAES